MIAALSQAAFGSPFLYHNEDPQKHDTTTTREELEMKNPVYRKGLQEKLYQKRVSVHKFMQMRLKAEASTHQSFVLRALL